MRKTWFAIVLSCLLVLVQSGALVHELSHRAGATSASRHAPSDPAADTVCSLCLAFAQIAAFAPSTVPALAPAGAAPPAVATQLPRDRGVIVARGHNRDPPPAS
ncbi:MAG: hypothetical protein KGI67_15160 [Pseudomonadota bacterium]|nr:hypothetical protein [Pseudomonadota bacterium]